MWTIFTDCLKGLDAKIISQNRKIYFSSASVLPIHAWKVYSVLYSQNLKIWSQNTKNKSQ
jgi:hypothetical protein